MWPRGVGAPAELGEHAGLADARLAQQLERATNASLELGEGSFDDLQLGHAPDQLLRDVGHVRVLTRA